MEAKSITERPSRMYLPRLAKNGGRKSAELSLTEIAGGNETILLAEDDPSLRVSVRKALSQLGYRILEALTGVKALEVWKENRRGNSFVADRPGDARWHEWNDLAQRILKENPKLKVIYMKRLQSAEAVGKGLPLKKRGSIFSPSRFRQRNLPKLFAIASAWLLHPAKGYFPCESLIARVSSREASILKVESFTPRRKASALAVIAVSK